MPGDHTKKENTILFAAGDRLLSKKVQQKWFEGFEKIEAERIGVGRQKEFYPLLETLSAVYLG